MSETDAVAATGEVYPNATTQPILLSVLFDYYGFQSGFGTELDGSPANGSYLLDSTSVQYFSAAVTTDDGSYLLGPDDQEYPYGTVAQDIPIGELSEFYLVPSGSPDEATLVQFNAETADTSYSRPATSVVIGTGTISGVDYENYLDQGQADAIAHAGYQFVIRYYSTDHSEVPLTQQEISNLEDAGLQIITVWENKTEQNLTDGLTDGTGDAEKAIAQAEAAGQPGGSAIYFAVDNNFSTTTVKDYFQDVVAVFDNQSLNPNGYSVGVYGSDQSLEAALSIPGVTYAWDWTNSGKINWNLSQVAQDHLLANAPSSPTSYITTLDPTGALTVEDVHPHHQITVNASAPGDESVYGVNIDVAKPGVPLGAFGEAHPTNTDGPVFTNDNPINVSVGGATIITSSDLSVTDSNYTDDTQLTYTILTPPSYGTLLDNGAPASSFTQADVDNGLISYQENGSVAASDYFIFHISDPAGDLTANAPFEFDITLPTVMWSGPSTTDLGGSWDTSSNWSSGALPSSLDDTVLSGTGTYTVTSGQENQIAQLDIQDTSTTLAITGGTFTVAGTLNNAGNIDVQGGTFVVQGPATGGTAIENFGTLEFGAASNVNVTFAANVGGYTPVTIIVPSAVNSQGYYSYPTGINNEGQVVGYFYNSSGKHGFLYSNGVYTTLDDPLGTNTALQGINDLGQIIGSYDDTNSTLQGFLYSNGVYTTLTGPSGGPFVPSGINDSGQMIDGNLIYSNGSFTTFSDPMATGFTRAMGINNDGQVVGYYVYGDELNPFVYSDGTYSGLASAGSPNGYGPIPSGINDAGQISGFVGNYGGAGTGFVYSGGQYTFLLSNSSAGGPDLRDLNPASINNSGQIVGPSFFGSQTGFLANPSSSNNMLVLDDPLQFSGTLFSFASGDTIDLASVGYDSGGSADLDTATNQLEVTENSNSYTFQLDQAQDFSGEYFHLSADAAGTGTDITESTVACYCRGTLIRTKTDEVPVEDLAIGDTVMTQSGVARPIKWIGRRSYCGRFAFGQRHILPIRISAGALAENVPRRDLWISPHHAMYLERALIEARDLVNGASIVQAGAIEQVDYFHIEARKP